MWKSYCKINVKFSNDNLFCFVFFWEERGGWHYAWFMSPFRFATCSKLSLSYGDKEQFPFPQPWNFPLKGFSIIKWIKWYEIVWIKRYKENLLYLFYSIRFLQFFDFKIFKIYDSQNFFIMRIIKLKQLSNSALKIHKNQLLNHAGLCSQTSKWDSITYKIESVNVTKFRTGCAVLSFFFSRTASKKKKDMQIFRSWMEYLSLVYGWVNTVSRSCQSTMYSFERKIRQFFFNLKHPKKQDFLLHIT